MDVEKRELTFSVQGEFITNIAREWFYMEGKPFDKVMELLMDCMSGTDETEAQIKRHAEDILLGRAALKGNTGDGTYRLVVYEPGEEETLPKSMDIWREVKKRKDAEESLRDMVQKWNTARECIPEDIQRAIRRELDEETEEDRRFSMLDDFLERMADEEEHTTADYGWLEPNGKFHEVDWGNHQDWANNYVNKNFPDEVMNTDLDIQRKCDVGLFGAADWLVERGWVLLHNPGMGIATPTKNPAREFTKAQKEFLYDYYMERNRENEANAIWEE